MEQPVLTTKQNEILYLVYRFRFLDRKQIQTMLNHKHSSLIKEWLADLTEKRVLARTYSRKFGENIKPAVYWLDIKSRSILKENENVITALLEQIYQEKKRSQSFRDLSMFIADIYLNLKSQAKESGSEFHFLTKIDLAGYEYLYQPLPNSYFVLTKGEVTKRYFLELISEQIPRFILRKHIEYLFNYYNSGRWEQYSKHPFPTFLIVCPNHVTRGFLSKFITKTRDSDSKKAIFYITTLDQIKVNGMKDFIWQNVE